ncbi:MAG: hypothetical protein R2726_04870 [Acidimicrobiales bacterium]
MPDLIAIGYDDTTTALPADPGRLRQNRRAPGPTRGPGAVAGSGV